MIKKTLACLLTIVAMGAGLPESRGGAIIEGFDSFTLARNDDGSTGAVNIGFTINYFGSMYSQAFVNNNGNITLEARCRPSPPSI